MTRIALMRHYPTGWNAEQRLQGRTDVPLTRAACETLAGLALPPPWDGVPVVASPLARAAETARLLAMGRPVRTDARLVEQSWGEWEGQRAADLAADPSVPFRPTHLWGPDDRAPGGESQAEAWVRVRPALVDLAASGVALVVTHKAMMRLILRRAGVADPEIKRGRLYPLTLARDGTPADPGDPVRLAPR